MAVCILIFLQFQVKIAAAAPPVEEKKTQEQDDDIASALNDLQVRILYR